jgi:tetratricopeptide (TPR) repeat protein
MRFERAALLLSQLSAYDEAIREYEHVRQTAPRIWKADARLAETELCRGREAEGFAVLDACIAELGRDPRGAHRVEGALAWRGELRLWMGRYEEGLADLDRAANHDHPFALGWRGAAHLLLGDPARAIADLDRALARNSNDTESLIWRGEARARTERRDEALADFDRAARQGSPLWALIGRALIKAHLGDAAGFYTDYDRLYTPEIGFFRAKPCVPTARDLPADAAWLDAVRKDAHGLRRAEVWLRPLWMKRWRDSAA